MKYIYKRIHIYMSFIKNLGRRIVIIDEISSICCHSNRRVSAQQTRQISQQLDFSEVPSHSGSVSSFQTQNQTVLPLIFYISLSISTESCFSRLIAIEIVQFHVHVTCLHRHVNCV